MKYASLCFSGLVTAALSIGCTGPEIDDGEILDLEPLAISFPGYIQPSALASGPYGDLLIGGRFSGTVDFGGGVHAAEPQGSVFLAHLDAHGGHLFSGATGNNDSIWSVAIGPEGDLYAGGGFDGLINFGSGKLAGDDDGFIAAFESGGVSDFSRSIPGKGYGFVSRITPALAGEIAIAAVADDTTDFGGGVPEPSQGVSQVVVAMYDHDGQYKWEQRITTSVSSPVAVAIDPDGNVIIASASYSPITLGGLTADAGLFVAKIAYSGQPLWLYSGVSSNGSLPYVGDVATDYEGNIYLCGVYYQGFFFKGITMPVAPSQNGYLIKLASDGSGEFGNAIEAASYLQNIHMAVSYWNGDSIVGVTAYDGADFGGGPLTDGYGSDVILGRFGRFGALAGAQALDGGGNEYLYDVAVDLNGDPVILGAFDTSLDIGETHLDTNTGNTMFVARFAD